MQIDFEALVFVILAATAIGGALGCVYARKAVPYKHLTLPTI